MKLILPLVFLLIPVLANCQTSKPGADSLIIPSVNREWNAFEFKEVYKTLLASQNGAPGGIITIENNAPLIAKLTNIESYWFLDSKDYTIADRINFCDSLQHVVKTVFLNYYQKSKLVNGRVSYEREIAGFVDVLLKITIIEMGIVDGVLKAQPNLTQKQTDGLKQFVQGATTMESGALYTIEKEYKYYSEASMCKLSRSFKDFYTVFYSKLDADVKSEFDRRIASMIKTHPLPCVRTALQGEMK
jgi:hypothetical protein